MAPGKGESGALVIEHLGLPTRFSMAALAIVAQLPIVHVIVAASA